MNFSNCHNIQLIRLKVIMNLSTFEPLSIVKIISKLCSIKFYNVRLSIFFSKMKNRATIFARTVHKIVCMYNKEYVQNTVWIIHSTRMIGAQIIHLSVKCNRNAKLIVDLRLSFHKIQCVTYSISLSKLQSFEFTTIKMHWHEGSIADAVSLSRKNGSIFVVYIQGKVKKKKNR